MKLFIQDLCLFHTLKLKKNGKKNGSDHQCFKAKDDFSKPKFYALDMFPYPSGLGLHIGHLASYTPTDIVARLKRAQGFNVLHPMGYDSFGLPAEQFAIQTGVHPEETTLKAINNFRKQLQSFGFSFDWSREVSTCDPKFYKWTQFIFTKLYEKGLAYEKEVPVNWCPALKTVLANEEVIDGKSERGGHPVTQLPMKQWMLKITAYAERLLSDLDKLDWPERTKAGQRNWIGKSKGARIQFPLKNSSETVEVFTTRADTLFGATFMVLAPEHPLLKKLSVDGETKAYIEEAKNKKEVDRKANKEKTGKFLGHYVLHPFSKKEIPLWVSDYVLSDYGSGAIMAVPAHDERDFEFAKKFNLEITSVIGGGEPPFDGDGPHKNSSFLDGLKNKEALEKMHSELERQSLGQVETQYKLRDWLFSRQRYWGEPFPMVRFPEKGLKALPKEELPVLLPDVDDYAPTESGQSPLEAKIEFVNYQGGKRITHTMPGSAGSSWYFLRYTDPQNDKEPFSFEKQKYWMPVDLYVGGAEHTVGHLLYARFWQKVLFDIGLTNYDEPFTKLVHQGVILDKEGLRMSKSRGNVVNPDEVRSQYGSDCVRLYISFLGPFDKDKPWSPEGLGGVQRFVQRVWRLLENSLEKGFQEKTSNNIKAHLHKTLKKVTEDIEKMHFNTAISAMMILLNEITKEGDITSHEVLKSFSQMLMPFAPHISEEMWERLGEKGFVSLSKWPEYEAQWVKEDMLTLGVQVNGKTKGSIELLLTSTESEALEKAKQIKSVARTLEEKKLFKVIYRPGKILNLVVR